MSKNLYFGEVISFRITEQEKKRIQRIVSKNPEKYNDLSQFIRASIIRNLKIEEN